jgi:tight adherence protein C
MDPIVILLFAFISFFLLFVAVFAIITSNTSASKRVSNAIRGVRFSDKGTTSSLNKIQEKIVKMKISDNVSYLVSALIAAVAYFIVRYHVVGYFSDDLRPFILMVPLILFVMIPFFYKKYINDARTQEILSALPFIIDLLIICLEAGLSFSMSIEKIIAELDTKSKFLTKRFQLMVYELNAGIDKKTALKNLVQRCYNHPDLKSFVSSITQSETLGFSIVQTLRVQSEEVRLKKRQMLKTRIARMPITLLFPLIFCIFPITGFLLVGPGLLEILKALK